MIDAGVSGANGLMGIGWRGLDCALSGFLSRDVALLTFCLFTFSAPSDRRISTLHLIPPPSFAVRSVLSTTSSFPYISRHPLPYARLA